VNTIRGHFQNAVNAVRGKIDEVTSFVRGLPGRITGAIGNLGSLLYNAGQNVISGLINGITSRLGALRAKAGEAASAIRDSLPFSPAKEGPLSGQGDPTIAGGKIVNMVAKGMKERLPELRLAAFDLGGTVSALWSDEATMPTAVFTAPTRPNLAEFGFNQRNATATTAARPSNTYNITVNSLDPRSAGKIIVESIKTFEQTNGKGWRAT
jgi:hypothetical protein